ncbi:hypothetical protein CYMTET_22695 [Cymbomonas tetramitiformis]|uniref:Uncharacterized protein n=1 Tax=Cymbomonas tetramitiformis TaxID=36881 RepID=A0AAE0G0U4_9CHLO|nr:hypothetical protein CYMTET_22695 [Cymbomonas tetramitiformis]
MPICVLRAATGPVHAYSPNWRDRRGGRRFYPFCGRVREALGITVGHDVDDWKTVPYLHKHALQGAPAAAREVIRQHLDWLRV